MSWLAEGDVADAGKGAFADREHSVGTKRGMWLP